MITAREIVLALLLPLLIAAVAATIAARRKWAWLLPAGAGVAFFIGYAAQGWPYSRQFPPSQGSDWLMWVALAAAGAGVVAAVARPAWLAAPLGALAGVAAFVIARPLSPHAIAAQTPWTTAVLVALAGVLIVAAITWSAPRVPLPWMTAVLAVSIAGAGALAMSSSFRTMGVYALASATALAPVAVAAFWFKTPDIPALRAARGIAVYAITILAGVLTAAHFYPDPGISRIQLALLLLSPAAIVLGALAPLALGWAKGIVALAAVAALVAAVAVPPALKAHRASQNLDPTNPYSSEYP